MFIMVMVSFVGLLPVVICLLVLLQSFLVSSFVISFRSFDCLLLPRFLVCCFLVGEVRHLGEFGGRVPPPYRSVVVVCLAWLVFCVVCLASDSLLGTIALTLLGGGHSP